jgi:hypothetical protein
LGIKNREFYADFKMQIYHSDEMPPEKVKIKKRKKWDLAKLENSFLILTFWGAILSLRQVCFFEISIKFSIFDTVYDIFKKKIHVSEGPILKFINTETKQRQKHHKIKKNPFSNIVLDIFGRSKTT